jgi:hypothetical protein
MSAKSVAQAAIEELRAIKDRCAAYAEDLRIRDARIAALEADLRATQEREAGLKDDLCAFMEDVSGIFRPRPDAPEHYLILTVDIERIKAQIERRRAALAATPDYGAQLRREGWRQGMERAADIARTHGQSWDKAETYLGLEPWARAAGVIEDALRAEAGKEKS